MSRGGGPSLASMVASVVASGSDADSRVVVVATGAVTPSEDAPPAFTAAATWDTVAARSESARAREALWWCVGWVEEEREGRCFLWRTTLRRAR